MCQSFGDMRDVHRPQLIDGRPFNSTVSELSEVLHMLFGCC